VIQEVPDEELEHAELVEVQATGGGVREGGREGRRGGGRVQVRKLVVDVVLWRGGCEVEEGDEKHKEEEEGEDGQGWLWSRSGA